MTDAILWRTALRAEAFQILWMCFFSKCLVRFRKINNFTTSIVENVEFKMMAALLSLIILWMVRYLSDQIKICHFSQPKYRFLIISSKYFMNFWSGFHCILLMPIHENHCTRSCSISALVGSKVNFPDLCVYYAVEVLHVVQDISHTWVDIKVDGFNIVLKSHLWCWFDQYKIWRKGREILRNVFMREAH
jgi:hypothetical protein